MGLFKKEFCCVCGKKLGFLQKKKLADEKGLCLDCFVQDCSAFIKTDKYTHEEIMQHIENLKTHEELYKSEFQKDEIVKYSNEFNEIAFSDELGLFAVQNKNLGQKFHEMFRYDQIRNYFIWVDKDAQDPVKLSRVEVILQLQDHPYCSKIRIMCAIKQSEYQKIKESTAEPVIKKLDEIFGKPHEEVVDKVRTNLSVNINGFSISTDRVSELTNFMKNGFGQGDGDRENEQYVRANKAQYTERANEAEKKYKITK